MTTHTPGRWDVQGYHVRAADCGTLEREGYHDHCIIGRVDGRTPAEAKANARLIAAAPQLLAALKEIASRGLIPGYGSAEAISLRLVGSQSIARAAIAAAEGKAVTR